MRFVAICAWLTAMAACDAFGGPRLEPVVITYLGDSVLTRGTTSPVVIAVTASGTAFPNPRLALDSSDPTTFAVIAGGDSLNAIAVGRATLTVRLESSILTDSMPTLSLSLRVRP